MLSQNALLQALDQMRLMPGLLSLCEWLDSRNVPRQALSCPSLDSLRQSQ